MRIEAQPDVTPPRGSLHICDIGFLMEQASATRRPCERSTYYQWLGNAPLQGCTS
jgi:hypothetical protein